MKKHVQQGFTLIELLIVIALLGALAVGLLASLDPFEQFKKGADTGTRNTVAEIQQGVIRYYSIKNEMPWSVAAGATVSGDTAGGTFSQFLLSIIGVGELKKDFLSLGATQLQNIYVTYADQEVTVCFQPTSKSFRSDKNTKFDKYGNEFTDPSMLAVTCPSTASCYWCVK